MFNPRYLCTIKIFAWGRGDDKGAWFPGKKKQEEGVWKKLVCKSWDRHRKQLNPGWVQRSHFL